ncbi:MAG: M23 family metallopeptidase [Bacteroidales bacterium]|nr:M23 family metallopeptidase [Bacteroidales bacterium]
MKKTKIKIHVERLRKKFQLSIFNESTLENVFSLRVSLMDGIFLAASVVIVLFFFSLSLLSYTPLKSLLPEDLDPRLRKQLVSEAFLVDSLADVMNMQTQYIAVLKDIISGDIPVDTLNKTGKDIPMDTLANRHLELMKMTDKEKDFRENYEESEKYNLSILNEQPKVEGLLFYRPIKGKILKKFNPKLKDYGVRIQIDDRQPALSVLDGTVLFTGYTSDFDYVIEVQHNNDYISVYKYNSELLKKQGDKVKAGQAIGIVGKNPARVGLPNLYFELWHKGIALNPEDYIVF